MESDSTSSHLMLNICRYEYVAIHFPGYSHNFLVSSNSASLPWDRLNIIIYFLGCIPNCTFEVKFVTIFTIVFFLNNSKHVHL